jgi:K+-sensing histidine kinase KdpD
MDYCRELSDFMPGDYVMIALSDNGCGITEEIKSNLFEPFFTTKKIGKGTTFRIYLPRHAEKVLSTEKIEAQKNYETGCETILLVEDEAGILKMTTMMLERLGYNVLSDSSL